MFRWCCFFIICISNVGHAEGVFLDFETAWRRALHCSPSLAIAEQEIWALEGEKKQVSLLPNPIATIEGDNLGVGKHHSEDADPPETTFALTQLLELGGKRYARFDLASSRESIAFYCAQIARKDLKLALATAFIEVSSAQERVRLAQERECVALERWQALQCLMEGGRVSPIQERKAHVCVIEAQLCVREARSIFEQARKRLAALWGSHCIDFDGVTFAFFEYAPPPACYAIENSVYCTAEYAKAQAEMISATKNVQLQRVNRVPDVALTVGYRIYNESRERGWVLGAEFPLPLFNRNQGNIQRACVERSQAVYHMDEVVKELKAEVTITQECLTKAYEELGLLQCGALAETRNVFELVQCGYQNGKYELFDVLEAHCLLIDIQEKYLNVLHDYHISRARLQRLIGEIL